MEEDVGTRKMMLPVSRSKKHWQRDMCQNRLH